MAQSRPGHGYEPVNPQPTIGNGRKGIFWRKSHRVGTEPQPNTEPKQSVKKRSQSDKSRPRARSTSTLLEEQPNKPQRSATQYYNIRTPGMAEVSPLTPRDRGREMMLAEFAAKYQNSLPQQVIVTKGIYCAEDEDFTISNSERLNIHFIRHRESVKIKELDSNVEYSVPLASTMEFGLVYNPYREIQSMLRGFTYPTVAEMLEVLDSGPLPKLVCAMQDSDPNAPGDFVTKGEILLVKQVVSDASSRELQVFSINSGTNKLLHESCAGNFTTRPEKVKLRLEKIIKHIPDALPMHAKIFPSEAILNEGNYPTHLFQKVIKLCRTFTDVLLVASSVVESTLCDGREPFEIPQEVELELKVVELPEASNKQLCEKSKQIHDKIQGEYIKHYRYAHFDQADYVLQEMFLRAVSSPDNEYVFIPPQEDSAVYSYPSVNPAYKKVLARLDNMAERLSEMEEKTTAANVERDSSLEQDLDAVSKGELDALGTQLQRQMEVLQATKAELTELNAQQQSSREESSDLITQHKQLNEDIQQLKAENVALREEVEEVRKEVKQLQENPLQSSQVTSLYRQELLSSPETTERNRKILATLNELQVVQLLQAAGVTENLEYISQESITGDILVELDDDVLQFELGITKRVQRLKVLKIIDGTRPVTQYIKISEGSRKMDTLC